MEMVYSSVSGFTQLYRGRKEGQLRAYKALKPPFRNVPFYESQLYKEFQIAYSLDHRSIVRVFNYFSNRMFGNCLEMEWVDGEPLSELVKSGSVSSACLFKIILQLCDVVEYLHQKQIIHRDIKPENMIITHNGSNLKLIDFGFSDSDAHCIHKEAAGTVVYASPELIKGGEVDSRTDIYSIGVIISHLLGRRYRHVASKCMARNPEQRYGSARELKSSLVRRRLCSKILPAALTLAAVVTLTVVFMARRPAAVEYGTDPVENITSLIEEINR